MEIIPNVHSIPGNIVNCFLVVDADGLTLIDTGIPGTDKKILQYLARLGHKPGDLRRILITHSDGDHIGGLAALKVATGARVCASEIEAQGIARGESTRGAMAHGLAGMVSGLSRMVFKITPTTVDEFLTDGQVLPILGGLRVVATPGHTPGHLSFFAPVPQILFAGDSLRSGNGRLQPSGGAITWDQEKANASIRLEATLGAKIVCPGHGPVVTDAAGKFPRV